MAKGKIEPRDIGFAAAGMGIAIIAGLAVFVLSGVYNVSAARPHLDPTVWLLDLLRRQSIAFHSRSVVVPPLDDPGLTRLGAAHFESGCAGCHGAPGRPANALTGAMLPEPPALGPNVTEWSTKELFWIVKNGQKYTGMPAWIEPRRSEEIWSVVSFLHLLPTLDQAEYDDLAGIAGQGVERRPFGGRRERLADILADCGRCHGGRDEAPVSGVVPVITGQLQSYLARTLHDYRRGHRRSGIMQLVASDLDEHDIAALAEHFAGPALSAKIVSEQGDAGAETRGAAIFATGIPDADVPACVGCHENGADHSIPRLLGQSADYVEQQLLLWQAGVRGDTSYEAVMAPIARRLTRGQIEDVAAYLSASAVARPAEGD